MVPMEYSKRIVGVFFDDPNPEGYPLNDEMYEEAYLEFDKLLASKGARLFLFRSQSTYVSGNTFNGGWFYNNGELQRHEGHIRADVILNKGNLSWDDSGIVINVRELEELCTDKSRTYVAFPEYSPATHTVHNKEELEKALAAARGSMVVAKPLDDEGGAGVHIASKDEIRAAVNSFPYLIQEFIDTSEGIPGVMEGYHDLRIACVSGEITHCYYRTPPPGSLLANVSQGGEIHFLKSVPEDAMKIFEEIDDYMKRWPERIYCIDLGRNIDGRWMIIEMNSKPGFLTKSFGYQAERFMDRIASLLIRVANVQPGISDKSQHPAGLKVGIFFDHPDGDGYPFDDEEYRVSYRQLATVFAQRGAETHIVRNQSTYLGGNKFSRSWKFNGLTFEKQNEPVEVDVIFNRGELVADDDASLVKNPDIQSICGDKWTTYTLIPHLMPMTAMVKTTDDFHAAITLIESEKIVIKPLDGFGGEGIVIIAKNEAKNLMPSFPCIVQEFIDTSAGIPGLIEGVHDLRLVALNNKIMHSYLRSAEEGKLLANVSQGGTEIEVLPEKIPQEARALFEQVDAVMKQFHDRHYSVDVVRSASGRWYVIELNESPGLSRMDRGPSYVPYFNALADFILSKAREPFQQNSTETAQARDASSAMLP
jgi:glutathione synthase/RimK-type ligase-like ATP-grasp enzyme